ncbi:Nonsense-mediated mRNA decay protein 5 [Microbotryomycetes sp. JL221]|nr:Nonsense-mediated mRNA decay protein 5 [Microbotryomycetes sp. JL221]
MDADRLFRVFESSFSQDPNVRIGAELELRQLEQTPGFINVLIQLISPENTLTTNVIKLAASIYLKNRIKSSWKARPASTNEPTLSLSDQDKLALKQQLLPLLTTLCQQDSSNGTVQVKRQIIDVLNQIISHDFPQQWSTLPQQTIELLDNPSQSHIETGLITTNCLFSTLRFNSRAIEISETVLPSLVTLLMPRLLNLSRQILNINPTDSTSLSTQGELIKLVVKSYKNSISYALVEPHQSNEFLLPWGSLLLELVQKQIPIELLPKDLEERDLHSWSKIKKWSCFSLNKLFERYGNPTCLPKNMLKRYGLFAENFIKQFATEILKVYLNLIQQIVQGQWVPTKVKHYLLSFLEECVKPKVTWLLVRPHILDLVKQFVFPLVCLTEEQIEQFSQDPQEFAKLNFGGKLISSFSLSLPFVYQPLTKTENTDFIQDMYTSPQTSALNFISTLVEIRPQQTLKPLLNFIQQISMGYQQGQVGAKEKDGVLRLLVCVASKAVKSKTIAPMMESFFTMFILPEFKSQVGFLRYRVCQVVERYESNDMKWQKRENLELTLNSLMECVTDPELPVRIQAAIALPELVRYEDIRNSMVPNIGRVIQELLKMSNEVDLDALTNTTRSLVGEFQQEVTPFAVELTQSLTESFNRLVQESLEQRQKTLNQPNEEEEINFDDEKMLVQMNLLKTIEQLICSLEGTELLDKVELSIVPALEIVIRNQMVELYDEVYEILDSLTFFQKKINPSMWSLFEATFVTFNADATDYVHEMSGFIDNCVTYGSNVLSTNTEYRKLLINFYNTIMSSTNLGADDRIVASKLSDSILLNLHGQIDEILPLIVEKSMFVLKLNQTSTHQQDLNHFIITKPLFLHCLLNLVMCICYNTSMTLIFLQNQTQEQENLQIFLNEWFKSLNQLNRVHDKKILIQSVCCFLNWLQLNQNSSNLINNVDEFLKMALIVFKDFPQALIHKREQERNFAEAGESSDFDPDEFNETDDEEFDLQDENDEEENQNQINDEDVKDSTTRYLDMLDEAQARKNQNDQDDDDDQSLNSTWSEEVLWSSPLDEIDAYVLFTTTLTNLEREAPQLFQRATASLTTEQRTQLEQIGVRAMRGGERADIEAPVQVQQH